MVRETPEPPEPPESAEPRVPAASTASVRPFRWLPSAVAALAAATVMAVLTTLAGPALVAVDLRRYRPLEQAPAVAAERFTLAVQLGEPRWLAVWRLDGESRGHGGSVGVQRLLPAGDPAVRLAAARPLAVGVHRVPPSEALDFEFAIGKPPSAVLVVASRTELGAADYAAIEDIARRTARPELAPALARLRVEARVLPFPAR